MTAIFRVLGEKKVW